MFYSIYQQGITKNLRRLKIVNVVWNYRKTHCQSGIKVIELYLIRFLLLAVINPCDSEPCLNDGSCINLGPMVFKCACARGFRGRTCESKRFPVQIKQVSFYLFFTVNSLSTTGEQGQKAWQIIYCVINFCIVEKKCEPNPCQNNGFCHESFTTGDYRCECPKPYKGTNCEGK